MNDVLPGLIFACTVRGIFLIAVAVVAGPWARRFLGRNGAHWLWLAVLPALLWPLPPRTALSLRNLWPANQNSVMVEQTPKVAPQEEREAPPLVVKIRKSESRVPLAAQPSAMEKPAGRESLGTHAPRMAGLGRWLVGLWLCGVGATLGQLCWRWHRTMCMLRSAQPITDERATRILERFTKRGHVSLAVTSSVRAPALAGIWRPRILIPESWLEELPAAELESVLLHELGHHLRRDLIWEWLYAIARCVHWMNPAVWLAERMARQERELACDAWALERSAFPEHYGEALVAALKRMHRGLSASFGVAAMAGDARQIARRLEWIGRYRSAPRWLAAAAWIPALLVLLGVASDPVAAQTREAATPAPPAPAADGSATPPEKKDQPAEEPLPLAKQSVEVRTRILRVPEALAKKLGWPIAGEESTGVQRIFSQAEFRGIIATLHSTPEVEIHPGPRLISRSGNRGEFKAVREFRFGNRYQAAAATGLMVPTTIESTPLGMSVAWRAEIKDKNAVHLNFVAGLTRLAGFVDANGTLTKTVAPPPGTDWPHRLVACEMPAGTGGKPSFSSHRANVDFDLNSAQVALVFGFRDLDQIPAPGASTEQTMVNYFAVQIGIVP